MLFHLHRGQMRARGVPRKMVYIPKSPKGKLMVAGVAMLGMKSGQSVEYQADKLGNINVKAPPHIEVMMGLGYPIYDGDGKKYPVPMDDLIFPNMNMDSTYWRRITEAMNLRTEVKNG